MAGKLPCSKLEADSQGYHTLQNSFLMGATDFVIAILAINVSVNSKR